jgi:adenylate cyclase, class 2
MRTIIEIKAACKNPENAEQILLAHGAFLHGIDHQIDTYLVVPEGRLKIREGNVENNLIYYNRTEEAGKLKESHVDLISINEDNKNFIALLKKALLTKVVVDKMRKIFFVDHVKFHIDQVQNLGSFIEIEAIDNDGSISKETLTENCEYYMRLLGIEKTEIINKSYSDMLGE